MSDTDFDCEIKKKRDQWRTLFAVVAGGMSGISCACAWMSSMTTSKALCVWLVMASIVTGLVVIFGTPAVIMCAGEDLRKAENGRKHITDASCGIDGEHGQKQA